MRSLLLGLLSVLFISGCGSYSVYQQGGYSFDKTGELRSRVEAEPLSSSLTAIEIDQRFGAVKVEVAPGAPRYEWKLQCWGKDAEDAERFVEEIQLLHTSEGDAHRFELDLPEDPGSSLRGVQSDLTLWVPRETAVKIRNRFGEVAVRGIEGDVTGECGHCAVELEGLTRPVTWKTSFSHLHASNIAGGNLQNSHGELRAEQVAGDLVAETSFAGTAIQGVTGRLEVRSSHGAVAIESVTGPVDATTSFAAMVVGQVDGRALLRNSHGGIRARGVRGALDARTSFAEIDLEASAGRVDVENSHGAVRLALIGSDVSQVHAETSFADLTVRVRPVSTRRSSSTSRTVTSRAPSRCSSPRRRPMSPPMSPPMRPSCTSRSATVRSTSHAPSDRSASDG